MVQRVPNQCGTLSGATFFGPKKRSKSKSESGHFVFNFLFDSVCVFVSFGLKGILFLHFTKRSVFKLSHGNINGDQGMPPTWII